MPTVVSHHPNRCLPPRKALNGLYIHIPFCRKKCSYCDFVSYERLLEIPRFLNALRSEFALRDKRVKKFGTLYIGGGTPSVLSKKELNELLSSIARSFGEIGKFTESTFEVNPESADMEKLRLLREYGINRLSIGLQSTNFRQIRLLGRLASWQNFLRTYRTARKAGFGNIGVDLIYGVPGQTVKAFKKDLLRLSALRPEHISAYCLELHKDTPLGKSGLCQDDEKAADMYAELIETLTKKGYTQYEISNFALKGRECKHNLNYWNRGDYLGFGPAAASHVKNERWSNVADLDKYLLSTENGKTERAFTEKLTSRDKLNERIILGLRKTCGIELDDDIIIKFNWKFKKLAKKGFLEFRRGKVRIKKDFLFVSNSILSELVE